MKASSCVIAESLVAFLTNVQPFDSIPADDLAALSNHVTLEYFPKDTIILTAGRSASDSLYIVQKGGVKLAIRTGVGKELILDVRSEGELFGLLSLTAGEVARLDVTAIEDTICYSLPGSRVRDLMSRFTDVADYFLRTAVTRYMDRCLNELRERTRLMPDAERLLYSLSISDIAAKSAVICHENTTIQQAARIAAAAKGTCIAVTGEDGRALGIITDRDFADKVVARGLRLDLPVTKIMTTPVIAIQKGEPVFEALLAMIAHDIHHVLITEHGRPCAVLTNHDLMLLQGKSPLSLARHIEQQNTVSDLAGARNRMAGLVPLLMREGAKASHITRVVSHVGDRLISKVLRLAEEKLGPPPVPYCWIALGSEGRREQTFRTDQDNGLIYADGEGGDGGAAGQYFAQFTAIACDALSRCGYPPCPAGYMASNPRWRQPLRAWQDSFNDWTAAADLPSAREALPFFDMRPIAGDFSLFAALSSHARAILKDANLFKSVLAFLAADTKPPLGFFRTFVVERSGEHKEELDIKLFGTQPIISIARLFAIDAGVEHTNTIDRLAALEALPGQDCAILRDLRETFEFLMLLRLERQLNQARSGQPLGNYLSPGRLTTLQRTLLKQGFQTIARAQSLVEARFKSAEWWQLGR